MLWPLPFVPFSPSNLAQDGTTNPQTGKARSCCPYSTGYLFLLASFAKPPPTVPSSLFLLSTLALRKKNTRQLYYFKTSQIAQNCWALNSPALMLSANLFQPLTSGGGCCFQPPKILHSCSMPPIPTLGRKIFSFPGSLLFLLGPGSLTFALHPAVGFCLLYWPNEEPVRETAPPRADGDVLQPQSGNGCTA